MAVVGTNPMTFEGPFEIVGGVTQELTGITDGSGDTTGDLAVDYHLSGSTIGESSTTGTITVVGPRRIARGMVGWRSGARGVIDFS